MGTRADFWIRKGSEQEWVGSIAWDGYHEGIPSSVKNAKTEEQYRLALKDYPPTSGIYKRRRSK